MAKVTNLAGCYKIKGHSKWVKDSTDNPLEIIVGQRKQPTVKKPKEFLLFREGTGRPNYLSSIYTSDTGKQFIEFGGVHYTLEFKLKQVCIQYMEGTDDNC